MLTVSQGKRGVQKTKRKEKREESRVPRTTLWERGESSVMNRHRMCHDPDTRTSRDRTQQE